MSEQFGKEWHVEYRDYRERVALYHFTRNRDGGIEPIQFTANVDTNFRQGDVWIEPSWSIRPKEAQQLMDELWRLGIRPAGADSSPNHIAALSAHLEDMRRLVLGPAVVQWPTFPTKP